MKDLEIRIFSSKVFCLVLYSSTSTKTPSEGTRIPMAASVIRAGGMARRQAHVDTRLGNWLEESLIIDSIVLNCKIVELNRIFDT